MRHIFLSGVLCLLAWEVTCSVPKLPLNDFIKHYETLSYLGKAKLYRRAADEGKQKTHTLEFDAHQRSFKLRLRPDTTTLAPDAQIVDGNGKRIEFDRQTLSIGELVGEPGSNAHGVLHEDGTFTGKIYTKDGAYFVESAKRYFDNPTGFHSVIYKDKDVEYDIKFHEPKTPPLDSLDDDVKEKHSNFESRERRAATTGKLQYEQNTCRLSMEADYTFLEMAKEPVLAVGEILKHVQALNIIYGRTFNTSDTFAPYSIQFQVGFLQVYNKEQTPTALQPLNMDISTFLNIMTRKDYSQYCQAVYFTHRDFEGGILGLAWIGYARGRAGGMCDHSGGRSYNTAVVTFTLYGRKSPPKVSEITFAHEVGHAFGAEHDGDRCSPGGEDGNYIMFDKATSGDRERNDLFSSCSIVQIKANVNAKRDKIIDRDENPVRRCLEGISRMQQRAHDLCGNGVIEGDEECDCGPKALCDEIEPGNCCDWKTCKFNRKPGENVTCSPSQGPCCDNTSCKPDSSKKVCEEVTDCLQESRCPDFNTLLTTQDYRCPGQMPQGDNKPCDGGAFLCRNGSCTQSICSKYRLRPCECKEREHECNACCMDGKVCRSAHKIKLLAKPTPYNYNIGTPCANNTGYCDFFHYCQRVDMDGPLLQLFKLYFTAEGVKELTRKYWWAILLGTLVLVGIVVLLVLFGARYTESNNPELNQKSPPKPLVCCKRNSSTDNSHTRELREGPGDEAL